VGLDPAHDVVLAGLDVNRLPGDVHAREVAARVDNLPAPTRRPRGGGLWPGVRSGALPPSGKPRPSLISVCSARETTSREASSSLFGAYFSMNRSPSAFSSQAPSPRAPSVISSPLPASVVGWYWIISMSISLAPIRNAWAIPGPVTISPLVVGL